MVDVAFEDERVVLWHGDCLDVLKRLDDASVDAVVTDPPYGLEFMGKDWDRFGGEVVPVTDTGIIGRQSSPPFAGGGQRVRYGAPGAAFGAWCEQWAAECLRVLKPGGHLLAFGGTRTWHRLTCAIEDAGFEIRDTITWLYGSGFPKSLDVSKAIDRIRDWALVERLSGEIKRARIEAGLSLAQIGQAMQDATGGQYGTWYHRGGHMFFETGRSLPSRPEWGHLRRVIPIADELASVYDAAEREVVGSGSSGAASVAYARPATAVYSVTAPATDDARNWQGWGTALKPASEPVVVARKPLAGTVAATVLAYSTGALNIDECRVEGHYDPAGRKSQDIRGGRSVGAPAVRLSDQPQECHAAGRWPSNVVLTHAQAVDGGDACADGCVPGCPVADLDAQSGVSKSNSNPYRFVGTSAAVGNAGGRSPDSLPGQVRAVYDDEGGASRYFPSFRYQAKAPTRERPKVLRPPALRLREDLTDEQRDYVLAELKLAGIDVV